MNGALRAAALLAVALLGACTRVETAQSGRHSWTQPGVLRVGLYEEPDTLNPAVTTMAFANDVFQLLFDGLIRFDDKGRPVPDLATEVPSQRNGGISRDGKTIVYHLVHNARWHDGAPLTSADVAFTYRVIMNPANNVATRVGYDRIARIETPDSYTVRVTLKAPYAPAIYLFRDVSPGPILPQHLLARYPNVNRIPFNTAPVGSGPYVLRSWQHGSEMRFDANPAYFRGRPAIDHVVFKFVPDQNTLLAQLRTHELDMIYGAPPYQVPLLRAMEGVRVVQTSTLHWEHMAFNVRRPPLDERNVRLALCYAMDERAIFEKIYHGDGTPGPTDQNPDFGWYDPHLRYYPHDLAQAGRLLDAAGWRLAADGLRYRNGVPLATTLSTVAGVKDREAIEVMLQSEWHKAGVQVEIKNFPAPTLFAPAGAGGLLFGGKTDVAIFTWVNPDPDPDDESYIGPHQLPPIGQNVTFFADDRIGRAQAAALAIYDPVRRLPYYHEIQRIILAEVPEYTFNWLPEIDAANEDLQGLRPVPVGSDFWNVAQWSL